jgi:glycosyltransferase involved in cell wall biosynthesis
MLPKISVVIPVYNTRNYLQEAIESILIQKKYIHEIIIVNDGSTDGSGELLENLYSKNEIIKIIHTQNQGQGLARNLGTQKATGNYIYYFDSDDICINELFKDFLSFFLKIPDLDLFCFSGESFLDTKDSVENIRLKGELSSHAFRRKLISSFSTGEEAFCELYKNKSFSPVPYLYIFKKSILSQNNILFRNIRYEDEEFTQKLFLFAGKTYIFDSIYCKRRVRSDSVMQISRNYKDIEGYIKTIETFRELTKLNFIKLETKTFLYARINDFARIIIILKSTNKIIMSREQNKYFKNGIDPILQKNKKLKLFSLTYPIEYKLRMFKLRYFN